MRNERGSVLLELVGTVFLFLLLFQGLVQAHRAWTKRFEAIVRHRNESLERLRAAPAERVSHRFFPVPLHRGDGRDDERSGAP
jgi:hypothetical protein